PLGAGKNKGWGRACVGATLIEVAYFGQGGPCADGRLRGCAEMISERERSHYGMVETPENHLPAIRLLQGPQPVSFWRSQYLVANDSASAEDFWKATRSCFDKTAWDRFPALATRHQNANEKGHKQELQA